MTTVWMNRTDWTDTPARSNGSWSDVRGMVAHYPASGAAIGKASKERVATLLRGWRSYHVGKNWGDIGYNVAIDQTGRIWVLRGLSNVGAHCASASWPTANRHYVGVLFVVGNDEPLTPEAVTAWHDLRDQAVLKRFPGAIAVTGHGLVTGASTACPGTRIRAALPALRSRPQYAKAPLTPTPAPIKPPPVVTPPAPITPKEPDMSWETVLEGRHVTAKASTFVTNTNRVAFENRDLLRQILTSVANQNRITAKDIATALLPGLIEPITEAVGTELGLTVEQVEQAAEKAVRNVLGSLG
jgi:hypothetical protein